MAKIHVYGLKRFDSREMEILANERQVFRLFERRLQLVYLIVRVDFLTYVYILHTYYIAYRYVCGKYSKYEYEYLHMHSLA